MIASRVERVHEWKPDTASSPPSHYCTDSEPTFHISAGWQCLCQAYFIYVQEEEVETLPS